MTAKQKQEVIGMVERVARAIGSHPIGDVDLDYLADMLTENALREIAIAAIEAMREPTDAMFAAAPSGECPSYVDDLWQDMIDAALVGG